MEAGFTEEPCDPLTPDTCLVDWTYMARLFLAHCGTLETMAFLSKVTAPLAFEIQRGEGGDVEITCNEYSWDLSRRLLKYNPKPEPTLDLWAFPH